MQPLPTVAKAYSMIRQEEKQREGMLPKPTTSAAFSSYSNASTFRNYKMCKEQIRDHKEGALLKHDWLSTSWEIQAPVVKSVVDLKGKIVNAVVGQDPGSSSSSNTPSDVNDAVFVRMD
ncbi:hypothetical protein Tco_1264133 [Tanacetum coccineum]